MRVFTGSLATETNTFAPMPTGLAAFKERRYFPAGRHPAEMSSFGGPLWAARQHAEAYGWTLIEGMVASAQPGGTVTREAYESLRDELLADLRGALPVDIVLLGLHGAMVADGYDDCEGDLLARVREMVGSGVVVGAELDPHAHLSEAMIAHSDVLVAYKEYPHTDILERAYELVDLCWRKARLEIAPVSAVVDCGMVVPIHTTREPGRSLVERIQSLEGHNGILTISLIQGFATGDVPDMGTKVLVYADGDATAAQQLADELARDLVALRDSLGALSRHRHGARPRRDCATRARGAGRSFRQPRQWRSGRFHIYPAAHVRTRHPRCGARSAMGSCCRQYCFRRRCRRAARYAHRRQDRAIVGRPGRWPLSREGRHARPENDRQWRNADANGRLRVNRHGGH
jgi:microcystin degradation protein MlrC